MSTINIILFWYIQLSKFLLLKDRWDELERLDDGFIIDEVDFWEKIAEIVYTLEFPYLATKEIERRDFCYTDVYLWSRRVHLKLDEIIADDPRFNFAATLKQKLSERQMNLLETPIFIAALFLDPRFKNTLSNSQKDAAIETLKNLYVQIKQTPPAAPNPSLNRIDQLLEAELFTNIQNQQSESHLRAELTMAISAYIPVQARSIKPDALNFWKENKNVHPKLYELAKIVFAIASSIAESERSFSGFAYIYNMKRMNLKPINVTNILMIRLNKDLFYQLRETKIREIINKQY